MASNLPPGVTEADIDRRFGGPDEPDPITLRIENVGRDEARLLLDALDAAIRSAEQRGSWELGVVADLRDRVADELPEGWDE